MNISKQQLTPLMNKLEDLSYVVRIKDDSDKRMTKINLLEEGNGIVSKRFEEFHTVLCDRIQTLNEDNLIDLDVSISKLNRIMGRLK